jgi:hypothetical protein
MSSTDEFAKRLNEFLAAEHSAGCILILDPNDRFQILIGTSTDILIAKLEEFTGSIIIIARSIQDGSLLAGSHNICDVHGLDLDSFTNLLRRHLGPISLGKATENQLIQVVQSVACLARAILQLSSFLNNSAMQVSQLLDLH